MKIVVKKFPAIEFQGQSLIWDSRQPQSPNEWVLVHLDEFESPEIRKQLLARPGAQFIGPPGSGMHLEVSDTRKFLGLAAAAHYHFASQKLKVFAVTGTNGKTTCTTLLRAQLVARGLCVAELGTLGLRIFRDDKLAPVFATETGFTTADAPTLQDLFAQFVAAGVDAVVMEASSHASTLGRVAGTDFDGMLYTNLTQDHLDFHHTMDAYEDAKARLFFEYLAGTLSPTETKYFAQAATHKTKYAVINADDTAGLRLLEALPPTIRILGFKSAMRVLTSHAAIASFSLERASTLGNSIHLSLPGKAPLSIVSPLIGLFNAENVVGSVCLLELVGLAAPAALADFQGAEGRMQAISTNPAVFVDYSHTPDALEKALSTLRQVLPPAAKLVVVFGCGGDRDPGKRPIMGRIAATVADEVIICSDNPRTENPNGILQQIAAGVPASLKPKVRIEENRHHAIELGIKALNPNQDALLIAGKGHEEHQIIGTTKHPFSDTKTAQLLIVRLGMGMN